MVNQLRIKIARDVIAQVKAGRFIPQSGRYLRLWIYGEHPPLEKSFQDVFKEYEDISCTVCALGATFISIVNINNKCSLDEVKMAQFANVQDKHNLLFDRVQKIFGIKNMVLIESAFERQEMNREGSRVSDKMCHAAVKWGDQYRHTSDRLIAIMRNVIRNGGNFKIPKRFNHE